MSLETSTNMHAPNLTQRPPRSPRCQLGGIVVLPRLLDKGRALIAGTAGEYKYYQGSKVDAALLAFLGIAPEALLEYLKTGAGDGQVLAWIHEHAARALTPWEIEQWSAYMMRHPGFSPEGRMYFAEEAGKASPPRNDVVTLFDFLDFDDYRTFGGAI